MNKKAKPNKIKVPFLDVRSQNKRLFRKSLNEVARILKSGDFVLGREVREFEREFAAYCGTSFAVGVASGTDALFLSLLSLGIGRGDEVICPAYTYIATALSVSYTGAVPVFADIEQRTFNLDPRKIEKKITKKTKAIIAVHLYGLPAAMEQIKKIARAHKLKVIEDAAQAHGAVIRVRGGRMQRVGSFGDTGCFSFYPTKNLSGCGDGGMITTNSKSIYARLLMLRDQGRRGNVRYLHFIKGYNSRLDSLQAALLRVKFRELENQNALRRRTAAAYERELKDENSLVCPYQPENMKHVFHVYALQSTHRDKLYQGLLSAGIGAGVVYHLPLHLQKAYSELGHKRGDFPVAEKTAANVLCLPMHANLNARQIKLVTGTLKGLC